MELVQKAKDIYEELDDHSAMATTLQTGAEVALRLGDLKEALRLAKNCENEFSRLADTQGLAAAFRILGTVQLVGGRLGGIDGEHAATWRCAGLIEIEASSSRRRKGRQSEP